MTEKKDWKYGEKMCGNDYTTHYIVDAYCSNCDTHDSIAVRKGTLKPKVVSCPKCGCETLKP